MIIPGNPMCTITNDLIEKERRIEELVIKALELSIAEKEQRLLQQNNLKTKEERSTLTRPLIKY